MGSREANGEVAGYEIHVQEQLSNDNSTVAVPAMTNSTIIYNLLPYTLYSFSIRALTGIGAGPFSNDVTLVTNESGT